MYRPSAGPRKLQVTLVQLICLTVTIGVCFGVLRGALLVHGGGETYLFVITSAAYAISVIVVCGPLGVTRPMWRLCLSMFGLSGLAYVAVEQGGFVVDAITFSMTGIPDDAVVFLYCGAPRASDIAKGIVFAVTIAVFAATIYRRVTQLAARPGFRPTPQSHTGRALP
jgi:hypothetical protein